MKKKKRKERKRYQKKKETDKDSTHLRQRRRKKGKGNNTILRLGYKRTEEKQNYREWKKKAREKRHGHH